MNFTKTSADMPQGARKGDRGRDCHEKENKDPPYQNEQPSYRKSNPI